MLPETHPLIDSITQPFSDDVEMKLSACQILEEKFDSSHPSVTKMIERLELQDKRKFPSLNKMVLWIVAVTVLGFAIYVESPFIRSFVDINNILSFNEPGSGPLPAGLTQQEQLLLGDPSLDELTQKELLLESDPTNPAYFVEYAQAYQSENDQLPPDFLETAVRIDPENSFYFYWAAGTIGKGAVGKVSRSSGTPRFVDGVKLRPLPVETEYTIKDQAAYAEALRLIEKASQLPKFENYEIMMMKARMRLIPPVNSFAEYVRAVNVQFGTSAVGIFSMMKVSDVMNARAEELSKNGDKEKFISLAAHRDAFVAGWARREEGFLVGELIYRVLASSSAVNSQAAAERLNLTELAGIYRKQNDGFVAARDFCDLRDDGSTEKIFTQRASALSRLSLQMVSQKVQNPPPILDSDLKPSRMAEHELLGGVGLVAVALIILIATLFIFLFRFLVPRTVRLTAKRFAFLLKASDWIWIFSLGVALPILVFLYINRLSPVSGRDYGVSCFIGIFPGLHLSVLLLNLLLIPAVVTRWRLARRAAAFKFGSRIDLLSLPVIAVMLVYSIVAYPLLVKISNLNTPVQIGLAAPLVGWLGFVFFNGLRIILGGARSRIIQSATAIAVIPAYPLAIIALCLSLLPYLEGEKYWIPKDKLHLIDPDAPDLGAYECRVAVQLRKETNAILRID